jgi:hypothetical protein
LFGLNRLPKISGVSSAVRGTWYGAVHIDGGIAGFLSVLARCGSSWTCLGWVAWTAEPFVKRA